MDTLTASDAKREFGELLLKAQKSPVGINKNGKPVAVIVSADDYNEIQKMKQMNFDNAIREGLDDIAAGRVQASDSIFSELRKKL